MKRKAAGTSFIMALLLSATALTLVNLATANFIVYLPYITIKGDGSIEPETEFIKRTGNVYTLTGNISQKYAVLINCNNIVFDGVGHVIDGSAPDLGYSNVGLNLEGVTNVTVKNLEVRGFINGDIGLSNCYECSILRTKVFQLHVWGGERNIIAQNDINRLTIDGARASGKNMISKNNITELILWFTDDNLVTENNVAKIFLAHVRSNSFFKNNFSCKDNCFELEGTNYWDNGSIGNYWSDYRGKDANGDGIGDTPYFINENNRDNYPLMAPVDNVAPCIKILSPENKTYDTSSIPLNFTVNEATSQIRYSLDGEANVTIAGSTTLAGLANGDHTLTVYAVDAAGNVGSETVHFSVEVPFPTTLVAWASGASIAIAAVCLIYYNKKRKTKS